MVGHGTIVVGVDGSVDARRALDWAVAEARSQRRPVLAAHHGTAPAHRPLGSVTARCVHEAEVPVVIVPAPVLRHHERTDIPGRGMALAGHSHGLMTKVLRGAGPPPAVTGSVGG